MADERDFLSRWSRRKAENRRAPAEAVEEAEPESVEAAAEPEPEDDPEDHPAAGIDIDALDRHSDYSVFLNAKVPADIRHRALQKLWSSDPVFANVDGLNDYDLDYTDKAVVVKGLRAAFDASRKLMLEKEARERAVAQSDAATPDPEPASEEVTGDTGAADDADEGDLEV